jgi:hypothetical protein
MGVTRLKEQLRLLRLPAQRLRRPHRLHPHQARLDQLLFQLSNLATHGLIIIIIIIVIIIIIFIISSS